MRVLSTALAAIALVAIASPVFAAGMMKSTDSMMAGHSMMMKPGESMVVMPNGETMTMMEPKAPDAMMKANMDAAMMAAKPVDGCMVLMMGKDGKMMMMKDMKMSDGKMACDEMSMMKK